MAKKESSSKKRLLIFVIGIVVLIGGMIGGTEIYKKYQANQYKSEDSYKIETQRDESYDGFYTLTKLDENGKNTWDGLALYVEKDKIVSCAQYDYFSTEDMIRIVGEKGYPTDNEDDLITYASQCLTKPITNYLATGMDRGRIYKQDRADWYCLVNTGEFVCTDKVDFNRFTANKSDYTFMQECNLVPGYDETSQEVWLSKLINNEQSIYHEGYILKYYKDDEDMCENCAYDTGITWFNNINELFGANLKVFIPEE